MNVTVHAAETTTQRLLHEYLPLLLTTAGEISAEWAIWLSRPHVEISRRAEPGSVTAWPAPPARPGIIADIFE
jgi:IclR family pca regulon transcriptional regulator